MKKVVKDQNFQEREKLHLIELKKLWKDHKLESPKLKNKVFLINLQALKENQLFFPKLRRRALNQVLMELTS